MEEIAISPAAAADSGGARVDEIFRRLGRE
jgi:hypothetical protein